MKQPVYLLPIIATSLPLTAFLEAAQVVSTAPDLIIAAASRGENGVIDLAAGRFELREPLVLKSGTTLKGAGIARTTATPRAEGLFGFHAMSDFKTVRIASNLIECHGTRRPLVRNEPSAGAVIENNRLVNLTDTARHANQATHVAIGPAGLKFQCGVNGELTVENWKTKPTQP